MLLRNTLVLCLILLSTGLVYVLKPKTLLTSIEAPISVAEILPKNIGEWRSVSLQAFIVVDPTQQIVIKKLYSETLARTYIHKSGYVIMLSIAHGKNQQDGTQVHTPDICYPAQGFDIIGSDKASLVLNNNSELLRVNRLIARKGSMTEPLVYWTTIGTHVFNSRLEKKYYEFRYSLVNEIPDGMLVRVSSIDADEARALVMQSRFVMAMYHDIPVESRSRFFGEEKLHERQ